MQKKEIYKFKRSELIEELIDMHKERNQRITKLYAKHAINDVFDLLDRLLMRPNVGITLGKTGVLYNGFQKARTGRHPQNGTPLEIPDLRAVKWKPATAYKKRINE